MLREDFVSARLCRWGVVGYQCGQSGSCIHYSQAAPGGGCVLTLDRHVPTPPPNTEFNSVLKYGLTITIVRGSYPQLKAHFLDAGIIKAFNRVRGMKICHGLRNISRVLCDKFITSNSISILIQHPLSPKTHPEKAVLLNISK